MRQKPGGIVDPGIDGIRPQSEGEVCSQVGSPRLFSADHRGCRVDDVDDDSTAVIERILVPISSEPDVVWRDTQHTYELHDPLVHEDLGGYEDAHAELGVLPLLLLNGQQR